MSGLRIVDSHVHFSAPGRYGEFVSYLDGMGVDRAGIVSLPDRLAVNYNPEAFAAKLSAPERFYVFGGFDYTNWFFPALGRSVPSLEEQVERLARLGADGIKMWAGKPSFQALLGFGPDAAVYDPAFDAAARYGLPVVLHVADPPQFWKSERGRFGWSVPGTPPPVGAALPSFERLQEQAEAALARHRETVFIFPHLLFRAGNLETFSEFMRLNSNAYLDLSPGLYFYGDLHVQRDRARRFFEEFRERILFGTDAMWFEAGHPYLPFLPVEVNLAGARRLLDFLATGTSIDNPFALTHEELPTVEGLALSPEILGPLLGGNFSRIVGGRARPVSGEAIRDYAAEIESERRAIAREESEV